MNAPRFSPGSKAYTKDGRIYTVEEVDGGIAYCSLPSGAETEFPEANLMTEAEWTAKAGGRRDSSYAYLRTARAYTAPGKKVDRALAEKTLALSDKAVAGLLDYVAFTVAVETIAEKGDHALARDLSIVKCRDNFNAATPEVRINLLARVLGVEADMLANAVRLGENMARAMVDKGLATQAEAFEDFCDRPRR